MAAGILDVTLGKLTYGGEALGRLDDGRAVFVPFGLPGERVRIRLADEHEHFARGVLVEVLEPAPQRTAPRCKHFGTCGGCHYQHMPYEMQLASKAEILRDQLVRIGHLESPTVKPAVGSTQHWNYRNHVQFHLTPEGRVGYVRARDGQASIPGVMPIEECHLPEPAINALWPQLEFQENTGVDRVSIRAGSDEDLLLVLDSSSPETPEVEFEGRISVVHLCEGNATALAGKDHVVIQVLGRDFQVSAPSFFQVNTGMAEEMVKHVVEKLPVSPALVMDVYCGAGLFSAFLAPRCQRLIGVESSDAACRDYAANLDEFENIELFEDAAERVLPALAVMPDAVLLDPPRAGLKRAALDAILRMQPGMIVYVSCDPSTLARDAGRLAAGGYRLVEVTPFDLFPQTYHIESISLFSR